MAQTFKSIDKNLRPNEKHFKKLTIEKDDNKLLALYDNSFSNITFDYFEGHNIRLISNNAFGNTSSVIKNISIYDPVNDLPPNYDIWKVMSRLTNVQKIDVNLNVNEIPTQAFGGLLKLTELIISSYNNITIKSNAFKNLDNLRHLILHTAIKSVEDVAFAFDNKSSQKMAIIFWSTYLGSLSSTAFSGIQRPFNIGFMNMIIYQLPEQTFKSVLDNKNNIVLIDSAINCTNCLNYWMTRDDRDKQVINAYCTGDESRTNTLFSFKIKSHLKSRCKSGSGSGDGHSNSGKNNNAYGNYHCNVLLICLFVIMNTLLLNIKLL